MLTFLLGCCSVATADETVTVCGSYPNNVFAASGASTIAVTIRCPTVSYNGGGFGLFPSGNPTKGQAGQIQANAPAGLEIVGVTASQVVSQGLNDSQDFGGGFYWAGGGLATTDSTGPTVGATFTTPSSHFGIQLVCGQGTCKTPASLTVGAVALYVRETVGPLLSSPSGLWQATGWIRGVWPFSLSGDSASGVCQLAASLNSESIGLTTSATNSSTWHQCAAAPISASVDTTRYGQGPLSLLLQGFDAAGVASAVSKMVKVDNQQPTVALSGSPNAFSTLGTQYVLATATAGPSGIAGISCSVDGSAPQWYASSTAEIPVAGPGEHQVSCTSTNNALDTSGTPATSAPATFSMKIGVPTVTLVAFSEVVNKLSCHRVTERVRIPARWVKVRVRGRVVRVRERADTQTVKVTRCHPHIVRRRMTRRVTIRRHGRKVRVTRTRFVRVVLEPRAVFRTSRRVGHGQSTSVEGWLGTTAGVALGDQTVDVLTAADNGRQNYHVAAVTTTAANGGWSARLPPGPSRLVAAAYAGAPTTEGTLSTPAHLVVPAKVLLLRISPQRVPWGGTVRLAGQLKGGYLPPGGALLRLRIGLGKSVTTYGVREHVTGNGRFSTTYTFGVGEPASLRTYWFEVDSLPMSNYPYAPADSRRSTVHVGGHPNAAAPPARRRRHRS